nr:MAG: nonstructural protein [Picornavirales sp.]
MVKVLNDSAFMDSVKFDARYLADITSQALMALQLISAKPSMKNLTLVFTCVLTKLNLPRDKLIKAIDFIKDSLYIMISSIASLGFKSEDLLTTTVDALKAFCTGLADLADDKVVDIVFSFLAKIVSFWTTLSGGFTEDDFDLASMPKLIGKMREIKSSGGDLIECLLGGYEWVVENFPKFIKGDFSGLFFGKAETSAYETRVSKVKKIYPIVASGLTDILKEEYDHTFSSYDSEVDSLVKTGDRMMKKAKPAQRPALKRMLDELREIQTDRRLKQSQIQTKPTAIGVCFVGGSGVGKSLLMEQTSRTLISAAGEVPSSDKIVTGQMSDKFDSNELPHHLSIQYDDVANNSANENFDKLLNAVNSQARPFLKAGVDEKGIMFPGNVACVISTNVPGLNAQKSNCPDSICRRFIHIETSVKPELIKDVCVPGTKRVDPQRAVVNGAPRMDIWDFNVYEFITFEKEEDEELEEDIIQWQGMYVRPIKWSQKPREERTFWDLALYLKDRARKHYVSQKSMVKQMIERQHEDLCAECCIPCSVCACNCESEFMSSTDLTVGIDRLITHFNTMHDAITSLWDIYKWRTAISLAYYLAPTNHKRNLKISIAFALLVVFGCRLSLIESLACIAIWMPLSLGILTYVSWRRLYNQVRDRVGILSHLAEDSIEMMRRYRGEIFAGISMVSFAYLLYRSFRPRSELSSYRETLPENVRNAFVRAEKARTTPIDNILPHIKRDLGTMIISGGGKEHMVLTFPIESNCYVTVGHAIPEGEFEIQVHHENALTPTVAKQRLSSKHVYRFPNKDLVLIQVPSAVPRRGYKDYLLGRESNLGSQVVNVVSMDIESKIRYVSATNMQPGWSMLNNYVKTDRVSLYRPYRYESPTGTRQGMCGSVIVDFSKAIIYGFHVAGNGKVGLCNTLTIAEINEALTHFRGFLPLNQGDLQLGSNALTRDLGHIAMEIGDEEHDKSVEQHNCVTEGVLPESGATFKDPYMRHPFKESIVREFGEPKFGPPQQINDHFHKRKALTKLTTPNQEFSLDELEYAADDYKSPIIQVIKKMKPALRSEIGKVLSLEEALDGIGEKSLGGIDNSTSNGYPFKGKKKDFLERDPLDPNIPLTPRQLVEINGVSIQEEMNEMLARYKSGITCRPLFKCSMKTNELLSLHKKKARVFMGSNFPFLLICRQYLAPIIRMMSREKILFESSKGINMDSVEAEELYNFLKVEEGKRVVALDYSAFDQTMSAQASTTAAGIMIDIMRELGCDENHINVVRGILTDITYPNLHFFGTVLQLANSDPSGNPITTELNGMVNSLYLRIFFFRIYPELKGKINYRDAIHTATYGDDNINGVPAKYSKFNGFRIVEEGAKVGLKITMADKDADITDFTDIHDSDFLKRKFRFCPDMKRIRAPLLKESIEKSIHWMKKTSPDTPEVLFAQNVDGMLRKSSQHGRDYFEEVRSKLLRIAEDYDVVPLCKWWKYDELIQHDLYNYYENYRGHTLYDVPDEQVIKDYLSEAKKQGHNQSLLYFAARMALCVGAASFFSVEVAHWYDEDGGRERMIRSISAFIRRQTVKWNRSIVENVELPYQLNGVNGIAEELGVPLFVAKFIEYCCKKSEPEFKSESFVPPQKSNNQTIFARVLSLVMEWFIALFPFINTGRYAEVGLTAPIFTFLTSVSIIAQMFIDVDKLPLFERTSLARFGFRIKETLVKQWLRDNNDVIRRQAFCILLEGPAGAGKTTCSLALAKHLIPDIKKRDIIVLNEDDDFQSELRSNHRVIILDDVLNTNETYLQTSPLRRVIDMVNNVPRRALSPDVELKGNIKINPELVILTTNVPVQNLLKFSQCPESLIRRWERFAVWKVKKFESTFDTTAWRFDIHGKKKVHPTQNIDHYNVVTGYLKESSWPSATFDEVANICKIKFDDMALEQQKLVDMVDQLFESKSLFSRCKEFFIKPSFKSESLDWDLALYEKFKTREITPENAVDQLLAARNELLSEHDLSEFRDVPRCIRERPRKNSWWQWFKAQFQIETFVSEGLSDYLPLSYQYQPQGEQKMPVQLSGKKIASLNYIRKFLNMDHIPDVLVEDDYVITFDQQGKLERVYFTTEYGLAKFAGQQYLLNERYAHQIALSTSPNFVDSFDLISFYKNEEEMSGFQSEGLEITTETLNSYCHVFGEEMISTYLSENSDDVLRFVLSQKSDEAKEASLARAAKTLSEDDYFDDYISSFQSSEEIVAPFDDYNGKIVKSVARMFSKVTLGTCPSRKEHQAQCEAHTAILQRLPSLRLVGREILIDDLSIDLLYQDREWLYIVEAKASGLEETRVQAQRRCCELRKYRLDQFNQYSLSGDHGDQLDIQAYAYTPAKGLMRGA